MVNNKDMDHTHSNLSFPAPSSKWYFTRPVSTPVKIPLLQEMDTLFSVPLMIDISGCTTYQEILAVFTDWTEYYNNDRYQWDLAKLSPREYYKYDTTGVYPINWDASVSKGDSGSHAKRRRIQIVSPANPTGRSSRSSPLLYPP